MKKLFLSFCMMALVALSSTAFGQSTGTAPYPGATHTYSVTSTTGAEYTWKVYKGTHATDVTTTSVSISGSGNSVQITWLSAQVAADEEYLVEVTEKITATGCQNTKALPVKIAASNFDLIVAADGDECYSSAVTVAWTGGQETSSVTYTHGDATIGYTIEAKGVGTSETWTFKPNFTYLDGASNTTGFSQVVTVKDASSNTVNADATTGVYTISGIQTVSVSVVVTNGNTYDNTSDVAAQNYTATMTLSNVASGTGSVEKTSSPDNNVGAVNVSRPSTTQISYN